MEAMPSNMMNCLFTTKSAFRKAILLALLLIYLLAIAFPLWIAAPNENPLPKAILLQSAELMRCSLTNNEHGAATKPAGPAKWCIDVGHVFAFAAGLSTFLLIKAAHSDQTGKYRSFTPVTQHIRLNN